MTVLYRDGNMTVVVKPAGICSESPGMPELAAETCGCAKLFCVHRLDKDVGGVMLLANSSHAAAELSAALSAGKKTYLAIVEGVPEPASGTFRDILFHDAKKNKTYIAGRPRRGTKEALLDYSLLLSSRYSEKTVSLVRVTLRTGRTHQIRIQFASRKMPVIFDAKYGSSLRGDKLALFSESVTFTDPFTGKQAVFTACPDQPWHGFTIT